MMRHVVLLLSGLYLAPSLAATIDLTVDLVTETGTPEAETAGVLASICPGLAPGASSSPPDKLLPVVCDALLNNPDALQNALAYAALSPRSNTTISTILRQAPPSVSRALLHARMAALRRRLRESLALNESFDFDGMRLPASWRLAATDVATATDAAPATSSAAPSRWSVYLNAEAARYEQDALNTLAGFDGQTHGALLGADYRIGEQHFVGLATQLTRGESDIAGSGGELDSSDANLTLYTLWNFDSGAHVDFTMGVGAGEYKLARRIQATIGTLVIDTTATGKPDSKNYFVALGVGYDPLLPSGLNGSVSATVRYTRAELDAYDESGGLGLGLHIGSQTVADTTLHLNAQVQKAVSLSWGVLLPQFGVSYTRRADDDGTRLNAYFLEDPAHTSFGFDSKTDDPDFALATLGASLIRPGGSTVFLQFEHMFLTDHFTRQQLALGWRWEI